MTPAEIYARRPTRTSFALHELLDGYGSHLPELGDDPCSFYSVKQTDVEIRIVHEFDYDGERFWKLATVWFRKQPVMVIQNAGRGGSDHRARFITDMDRYKSMVEFLRELLTPQFYPAAVCPNTDLPELTDFYGQKLEGPFVRSRY